MCIASPIFYNKFRVETIDAGVLGTKNLLELAREKKTESFLFFSSSEVYGNPDAIHVPTKEEYNGNVSTTGPRAVYNESKRFGETVVATYLRTTNDIRLCGILRKLKIVTSVKILQNLSEFYWAMEIFFL